MVPFILAVAVKTARDVLKLIYTSKIYSPYALLVSGILRYHRITHMDYCALILVIVCQFGEELGLGTAGLSQGGPTTADLPWSLPHSCSCRYGLRAELLAALGKALVSV